jgi:hypothetical protein
MAMARTEVVKPEGGDGPPIKAWQLLLVGVGLPLVAVFLPHWSATAAVVFRVVLLVAGLVSAGAAVWLRLHFGGPAAEERARSAGVVALAALAPLLAFAASPRDWDSIRLFLGVLTAVTISGAVVVLLPGAARRAVVSLLIVLHFGGILTAVASVAPPGSDAPWLVNQVWSKFYRFYLQFMYLNNAYHFYSPEPGPPTLLWFHLDYADGSGRWVRLPERAQFHTRLEYQRRLALTESTNMLNSPAPVFPPHLFQRRLIAGHVDQLPFVPPGTLPVPILETVPYNLQFRLPQPFSRFMVASYVRHVAHAYPSEENPAAEVTGVKVYRVIHTMLTPEQMMNDGEPTAPETYEPFFCGEFGKDGRLKHPDDPVILELMLQGYTPRDKDGHPRDVDDGFLYWVVPIMWVQKDKLPPDFPEDAVFDTREDPKEPQRKLVLVDFTRIHVLKKSKRAGQ